MPLCTMPSRTLFLSQRLHDRLQGENIPIYCIFKMDIPSNFNSYKAHFLGNKYQKRCCAQRCPQHLGRNLMFTKQIMPSISSGSTGCLDSVSIEVYQVQFCQYAIYTKVLLKTRSTKLSSMFFIKGVVTRGTSQLVYF